MVGVDWVMLLAGFESCVSEYAKTELRRSLVGAMIIVTAICTLKLVFADNWPRLHTTVLPGLGEYEQVGLPGITDLNTTLEVNVSDITTLIAFDGPLLVIANV
jgi:hypothetical protein